MSYRKAFLSTITTIALAALIIHPFSAVFSQGILDQLLQKVQQEQLKENEIIQQREAEFLQAKDQQQKLLNEAKAQLAALEKRTQNLTATYDTHEKELAVLEERLTEATGTLGEMFGVVKQVSADLRAQMESSLVSAQFVSQLNGSEHADREKFVEALATRKELPTSKELRKFWLEILRETSESGKIVSFQAPVVNAKGEKQELEVTRVGAFNLVTATRGGRYLNFQPETRQIVELGRQPSGSYLSLIKKLAKASPQTMVNFGIDPSRGTLLSMLVQAPDFFERVSQGGFVGYVILVLLLVGLILSINRIVFLQNEKKKIAQQLLSPERPMQDNSIGRLIHVYQKYQNDDKETLELKLDEAILKEIPLYERGVSTLKILAAIGPLMGLLGTVTGMIMTFQSITLFGTGDPKLMAGGISSALITTVLGLVCAIPMLLLHNLVATRAKSLIQLLEEQSIGLLSSTLDKPLKNS